MKTKKALETLAHESNLALRAYREAPSSAAKARWKKAMARYRRALNEIAKDAKKKLQQLAKQG